LHRSNEDGRTPGIDYLFLKRYQSRPKRTSAPSAVNGDFQPDRLFQPSRMADDAFADFPGWQENGLTEE
jgi:hypothetical protein